MLLLSPDTPIRDAFELMQRKGLLPSALSSREQRAQFVRALRESSVFSARTSSAHYLQTLREVLAGLGQGEVGFAESRLILREALDALGYTAEGGFPEDEEGTVPPAVEGSLQDLRSTRRLNLMLETNAGLMSGAGQQTRGMEKAALRSFPAWELVRVYPRREPRDWKRRFVEAGGKLYDGRMMAPKGDIVWDELGSSENFDDALDVDYPPFAYGSGKRWRGVPRAEAEELGVEGSDGDSVADILEVLPTPKASTNGLDPDFVNQLKQDLQAEEDANGMLTMGGILNQGGRAA